MRDVTERLDGLRGLHDIRVSVRYQCPVCGSEATQTHAADEIATIMCGQIHPHSHDRPQMRPVLTDELRHLGWRD